MVGSILLRTAEAPAGAGPVSAEEDRGPIGAYGALMVLYTLAVGGLLAVAERSGRLPRRPATPDVLLVGVATYRMSRLITKDRVTTVVRAPFTEVQGRGAPGELEERATGHGLRRAIGQLLTCPFCIAQWIATTLSAGMLFAPRATRWVTAVFGSVAVADALQLARRAATRAGAPNAD